MLSKANRWTPKVTGIYEIQYVTNSLPVNK